LGLSTFAAERIGKQTFSNNRGASISFLPNLPVTGAIEARSGRVNIMSDLKEEIPEESKGALITTLSSEDEVLVILL